MNGQPRDWYRVSLALSAMLADVLLGQIPGYTHKVTSALDARARNDDHAAGAVRLLRTEMFGRDAKCENVLYREGFEPLPCLLPAGHEGEWHSPSSANEQRVMRWRYTEQGEPVINEVRAYNGADAAQVQP